MLRRIAPEVIICYHTPFPEMEGNIVYVDYDLSSWKHDEEDLEFCWATFSEQGEDLHDGFCTLDKKNWICEQCFQDFKEMFHFTVAD